MSRRDARSASDFDGGRMENAGLRGVLLRVVSQLAAVQCDLLARAGGRAVAGSNPVSPIRRKRLILQAFLRGRVPLNGCDGVHLGSNCFCTTALDLEVPVARLLLPAHPDGALATRMQRGIARGALCRVTPLFRDSIRTGLSGRVRARGACAQPRLGRRPVDDRLQTPSSRRRSRARSRRA